MKKSLSFEDLPQEEPNVVEDVDVHEFGVDEKDGKPYTARVRALTVSEWEIMIKGSLDLKAMRESDNGSPEVILRNDFDDACLVAAWCTIDDDDRSVFGRNKRQAERRVRALPHKYYGAIQRIYLAALRASNIGSSKDEQSDKQSDKQTEKATKN